MTGNPDESDRQALREEQIRAAWVTEPPRLDAQVTLVDYDPEWPRLFAREESRIRGALGVSVLLLEHCGSTSVPGLAAKPVIDVVLCVRVSGDEAAYLPALETAGYVLRIREPEWFEHRCLKRSDSSVNLHVFSDGCSEVERMLLFRDTLRRDPAERALYERTKRELAAQTWGYVQNYADAKSEVVEQIMARTQARR
jgi:GrpB-like predicted nucleotidyltransferase (UPF0157 family)